MAASFQSAAAGWMTQHSTEQTALADTQGRKSATAGEKRPPQDIRKKLGVADMSQHFPQPQKKMADNHADASTAAIRRSYPGCNPIYAIVSIHVIQGAGGFGMTQKATIGDIEMILKFVPTNKIVRHFALCKPKLFNVPLTASLVKDTILTLIYSYHLQVGVPRFACIDKVVACVVNHSCLVSIFACFAVQDAFVTCMEYVRGVDLHKVLKISKVFQHDVLQLTTAQLGLAIQHLHFKGLIHRDIKPSNAVIMPDCRVKLIDFDTVKLCEGRYVSLRAYWRNTAREIGDREHAGTLHFYAPEAIKKEPYGRAIDWWALGVTVFQLANGWIPFRKTKVVRQLRDRICQGLLKWNAVARISAEDKALITGLLHRNPQARLCSRNYNEFQRHPSFKGVNWQHVEKGDIRIDFPNVKKCMVPSKDYLGQYSPVTAPEAEKRKQKLFNVETFKEAKEHHKLYTFTTRRFQECIQKHRAGIVVEAEDVFEEPELLTSPTLHLATSAAETCQTELNSIFYYVYLEAIEVRIALRGTGPLPEGAGFSVIKEPCLSGAKLDIVHYVALGSPAQLAGLYRSDIILKWREIRVSTTNRELRLQVSSLGTLRAMKSRRFKRLLYNLPRIQVQIRSLHHEGSSSSCPADFGIVVGVVRYWNPTHPHSQVLVVVQTMHEMDAHPRIFPGDVITEISSRPVPEVITQNVMETFKTSDEFLMLQVAPVSGLRVLRSGYGSSGAEEVDRLEDELLEKIKVAGYGTKTNYPSGLNLDEVSRASML
ncbi:microtubule-associated serine/threonine-protein kinase 3-like [Tropilaelaps mercedesae]|uniref:Microtubule-associated serine/threonine-protein kinase 3-like n=1 Tax=Tropilaelaps mercedesae TaxID=418985 RepID=A0A1V9XTM3_9ACAR|nr:microtubule-associated serine/threonine-protein kinase 3-like [Tropilaelaps mercedesae]